jgi:cob(I)alamin adenosyltransferase
MELAINSASTRQTPGRGGRRGLVIALTGDGKGKSTAAFGQALRAFGRGKTVCIFQFTKACSARVGEYRAFQKLGLPFNVLGDGFDWDCRDAEHCGLLVRQAWNKAQAAVMDDRNFLVVLDDITYALRNDWVTLDDLLLTLHRRPPSVHVVLTGRNLPQDLVDQADTVTRMAMTKHHHMAGVPTQRGIED